MNVIAMQSSLTYMLITDDNNTLNKSFSNINDFLEFKEEISNTKEDEYINLFLRDIINNSDHINIEDNFDTLNQIIPVEKINNNIYLRDIKAKVCLPPALIQAFVDNKEDQQKVNSLRNFWVRASNNPDVHITNRIFDFLFNCGMHLLPNGCFVAYRGSKEIQSTTEFTLSKDRLQELITTIKSRKKGLSSYVYDEDQDILLPATKERLAESCYLTIAEWQNRIENSNDITRFTDAYTGKMDIRLGSIVSVDRKLCDNNPNHSCSKGLHVGTKSFGVSGYGTPLACIVDPAMVVSIPYADAHKLRCCAYLPFQIVDKNYNVNNLDEVCEKYDFEIDNLIDNNQKDVELTENELAMVTNYKYIINYEDMINKIEIKSLNNY